MISQRMPFVNRTMELDIIRSLAGKRSQCVLCIEAEGGIGKTRLLQEVLQRYTIEEFVPGTEFSLAGIIDFDDDSLHIADDMGRRAAQALGKDNFKPYLDGLTEWRQMQVTGASEERLEQERERVHKTFLDCMNKLSASKRIIWIEDTFEAISRGSVNWNYTLDLGTKVNNILLIISGRKTREIFEEFERLRKSEAGLKRESVFHPLGPFGEEASEEYLQKKLDQLRAMLQPDLAQKLLALANGRPILIDLAVQWVSRAKPLDWLVDSSLQEITQLPSEERQRREEQVEAQWVSYIAQLETEMDKLTIMMSRIYPLDVDLISELVQISKDKAEELFEKAKAEVFVKQLPDGRISLHDEMRRMVNQHVWPRVDPTGDRQHRDSTRIVKSLKRRIRRLEWQMGQLETAEKKARDEEDYERERDFFINREERERKLWPLQEKLLRHTLFVDRSKGVKAFASLFDQATKAYQFPLRKEFVDQAMACYDELALRQRYEVDSRRVRQMLDYGKYEDAKALASEILHRGHLAPAREVETLIQLGNAEIRLGNRKIGTQCFRRSVEISREFQLKRELLQAQNALGWGYRTIGRLYQAMRLYREALELSTEVREGETRAWILNNLAFVHARLGEVRPALHLCRQAEVIWNALGRQQGLGAIYEVYGEAYCRSEWQQKALEYYEKARKIFEVHGDREWLARIYTGRGTAYWLLGQNDKAKEDFDRALEVDVGLHKPVTLHYLGHFYQTMGRLEEAKKSFEQSYEESRRVGDAYFELNCLGDLARLAVQACEFNRLEEFEQKYRTYQAELAVDEPEVEKLPQDGLMLKYLGDLALGANPNDISGTVDYYAQGLPIIARYHTYEPFVIAVQLQATDRLLTKLPIPRDQVARLGEYLVNVWKNADLIRNYPEAFPYFLQWREARAEHDASK